MNNITKFQKLFVVAAVVVTAIYLWPKVQAYFTGFGIAQTYNDSNAYQFPYDAGQITLTLAPGETSRWISTPPGSYWTDRTGGPIVICFIDGECFDDNPNMANWLGIRRGIFIIQNVGSVPITVTVAVER